MDITGTSNFLIIILVLIFSNYFYIKPVIGMACPESTKLTKNVNRCPRNALEWETRAALINCSSFSQTCVMESKFVYHCVLNADGTKLVEVCAPYKYIHGQSCAEFDSRGGIIQESAKKCHYHTFPCSSVYKSMDAFKYQSCYDGIVPKIERSATSDSADGQSCAPEIITTVAIVTGLESLIFSVVGILIYKRNNYRLINPERGQL